MILRPLAAQELAAHPGCTHMAIITADDLTTTAVTTAQLLKLCDLVAGDVIIRVEDYLVVPFEVVGTPGTDSLTRSIGDNAGVATWTAATESNVNGTEVLNVFSATAPKLYTAADKVAVNFIPKTGTSTAQVNKGELHVFFGILRVSQLSKGNTQSIISTK